MIQINNMLKFATKCTHSKGNTIESSGFSWKKFMSKLAFSKDWIDKVMSCVKHVGFEVLVNGCPSKSSILRGVLDKETRYLLTCFFCMLNVYMLFWLGRS